MPIVQKDMYAKAKTFLDEHITSATSMEEMLSRFEEKTGFVKAMWCGDEACEDEIKAQTGGATSRCIPFDKEQEHITDTCVCCDKKAEKMVIWGIQY